MPPSPDLEALFSSSAYSLCDFFVFWGGEFD